MGIVVSIALLLALIAMCSEGLLNKVDYQSYRKVALGLVGLVGLWNMAWYGIQNITTFWGITAFMSGLLMMSSVQCCYLEDVKSWVIYQSWYVYFKLVSIMLLGLYLLLYVVTIIQMNLGMPIIH